MNKYLVIKTLLIKNTVFDIKSIPEKEQFCPRVTTNSDNPYK